MDSDFGRRLQNIQQAKSSNIALWIAPRVAQLPLPIQRYDDPFLPYGKAIINVTYQLVCAYVFDLAAYMSIGAAGMVALERTIAYVAGRALTMLHGPFTGNQFVQIMDETAFDVDALTLSQTAHSAVFTAPEGKGFFVVNQSGEAGISRSTEQGIYHPQMGIFTWDDIELRSVYPAFYETLRGYDFAEQLRSKLETSSE